MKPLLPVIISCFATTAAQAQTDLTDLQKLNENPRYLQWFRDKVTVDPTKKDSFVNLQYGQLFLKGAKPGVHRLPQDGMPCIVPDTKDIVAIPNLFKGKVSVPFVGSQPHIPNPLVNDLRFRNKKGVSISIFGDKKEKPE
ncbi:MAG: hypothetical protein IAF38_11005 [Bacteroidia bacterium]|nr:hypothetical protein [Bacteroidia bacterium]